MPASSSMCSTGTARAVTPSWWPRPACSAPPDFRAWRGSGTSCCLHGPNPASRQQSARPSRACASRESGRGGRPPLNIILDAGRGQVQCDLKIDHSSVSGGLEHDDSTHCIFIAVHRASRDACRARSVCCPTRSHRGVPLPRASDVRSHAGRHRSPDRARRIRDAYRAGSTSRWRSPPSLCCRSCSRRGRTITDPPCRSTTARQDAWFRTRSWARISCGSASPSRCRRSWWSRRTRRCCDVAVARRATTTCSRGTPSATSASCCEDVTLHPAMGVYLSMLGNRKPDAAHNIRPDENYARELMQLFTIGLVQLNADGTVKPTTPGSRFRRTTRPSSRDSRTYSPAGRTRVRQLSRRRNAHERQADRADEGVSGAARAPARSGCSSIPARRRPSCRPARRPRRISPTRSTTCSTIPTSGRSSPQQLIRRLVTSNPVARVRRPRRARVRRRRQRAARQPGCSRPRDPARRRGAPGSPSAATEPARSRSRCCGSRSSGARTTPRRRTAATSAERRRDDRPGPLKSPSVFNFFTPIYAPPGEIRGPRTGRARDADRDRVPEYD